MTSNSPPATAQQLLDSLPKPPYFARLLDPRATLDAQQWHTHPELEKNRYFITVEHVLDRDEQHPGIWLRPAGCHFWLNLSDCAVQWSYTVN